MGGKIVQLVQGDRKALEFDNFDYWVNRFLSYPMIQLIDLDAAMGKGSNEALVAEFCNRLPCQVGGGIRSVEAVQRMLGAGAKKVIVGSALLKDGAVNLEAARQFARAAAPERLIVAVDARGGKVSIHGWKLEVDLTPEQMMRDTEPYCGGYLYTHIDTEGLMKGIPMDVIERLRAATTRKLIAAGGIRSQQEIDQLHAMGVDAVVGMALYTGALKA